MPLNCPRNWYEQNACIDCYHRKGNECWGIVNTPQKLSDILTISERVAILENRREAPEVNIVTITKEDYQSGQRLLLLIQEKLNKHLEVSKPKKKYKEYKVEG